MMKAQGRTIKALLDSCASDTSLPVNDVWCTRESSYHSIPRHWHNNLWPKDSALGNFLYLQIALNILIAIIPSRNPTAFAMLCFSRIFNRMCIHPVSHTPQLTRSLPVGITPWVFHLFLLSSIRRWHSCDISGKIGGRYPVTGPITQKEISGCLRLNCLRD
jgi:hypothetical protein